MLGVSLCICLRRDLYIGDRLSDTRGHSDFNLELLCPFDAASRCQSLCVGHNFSKFHCWRGLTNKYLTCIFIKSLDITTK